MVPLTLPDGEVLVRMVAQREFSTDVAGYIQTAIHPADIATLRERGWLTGEEA
jgi:hypothetical protein